MNSVFPSDQSPKNPQVEDLIHKLQAEISRRQGLQKDASPNHHETRSTEQYRPNSELQEKKINDISKPVKDEQKLLTGANFNPATNPPSADNNNDFIDAQKALAASQIASLKSEEKAQAGQEAAKMQFFSKRLQLPETFNIELGAGKGSLRTGTQSMINSMQKLREEQKKVEIPFLDWSLDGIKKSNVLVKSLLLGFMPTTPLAFLALSGTKTPAIEKSQALSLLQRNTTNSFLKDGSLLQLAKTAKEEITALNGLDLKTLIKESNILSESKVSSPEQSRLRFALRYLLSPNELLELSLGQNAKFQSQITNDKKNNRIAKAQEEINNVINLLEKSKPEQIMKELSSNSEKTKPIKTFLERFMDMPMNLAVADEGKKEQEIDPLLTDTLKMSKEQVEEYSKTIMELLQSFGLEVKNVSGSLEKIYREAEESHKKIYLRESEAADKVMANSMPKITESLERLAKTSNKLSPHLAQAAGTVLQQKQSPQIDLNNPQELKDIIDRLQKAANTDNN